MKNNINTNKKNIDKEDKKNIDKEDIYKKDKEDKKNIDKEDKKNIDKEDIYKKDKEDKQNIDKEDKKNIDKEDIYKKDKEDKQNIDKEDIYKENKEDKKKEILFLKNELNILKKKYHDNILRMHAEIENIKYRNKQEFEKLKKFSLEKIMIELLSVIDNLERALETTKKSYPKCKITIQGIELTLKGMLNSMNKFGLEVINKVNIPFDPNIHQAIKMLNYKEYKKNNIIDIIQKGYLLNNRLIRPAMVIVAK